MTNIVFFFIFFETFLIELLFVLRLYQNMAVSQVIYKSVILMKMVLSVWLPNTWKAL